MKLPAWLKRNPAPLVQPEQQNGGIVPESMPLCGNRETHDKNIKSWGLSICDDCFLIEARMEREAQERLERKKQEEFAEILAEAIARKLRRPAGMGPL